MESSKTEKDHQNPQPQDQKNEVEKINEKEAIAQPKDTKEETNPIKKKPENTPKEEDEELDDDLFDEAAEGLDEKLNLTAGERKPGIFNFYKRRR